LGLVAVTDFLDMDWWLNCLGLHEKENRQEGKELYLVRYPYAGRLDSIIYCTWLLK